MLDTLHQQIYEMLAHDQEPAAIIMMPPELKRWLKKVDKDGLLSLKTTEGSGYKFMGLPIYRCWEISGPCVLSREVFAVLKREYRTHWLPGDDQQPRSRAQSDLLF